MRKKQYLLLTMMAVSLLNGHYLLAQTQRSSNSFDSFDSDDQNGRTFNPFDNDSTKQHKEIPKGIYVWTVDQKFGDIKRVDVDTMPHLYPRPHWPWDDRCSITHWVITTPPARTVSS